MAISKVVGDLQLGDKEVTLNHLGCVFSKKKNEVANDLGLKLSPHPGWRGIPRHHQDAGDHFRCKKGVPKINL